MRKSISRVTDLAGGLMTERQYQGLRLSDFGGTFISPESGARGEQVFASYEYIPDVCEEEERVVANDFLRGSFIPVDELEDRSDEFDMDFEEDPEDGDFFISSVDLLAGPRFVSPKSLSYQPLYDLLKLGGPAYVIRVYEMAGEKGRLDLLNRLPTIVGQLIGEGIYSLGLFKQVKVDIDSRSFSASVVLRGKAAEELEIIGSEGGIACRILEILGSPIRRAT